MSSLSIKKFISVLLISAQLVQPALAAAQGHEYRIPLSRLKPATGVPGQPGTPGAGDGVIDVGDNPSPAEFTITPASHQFDITDGVRRTRTSLLANTGVSRVALSGIASNADFTVTSTCPAILEVGDTCDLSITPTSRAAPGAFYEMGVLAKTAIAPVFLQLKTVAKNSEDPAPLLGLDADSINLGSELEPGEAVSGVATLINLGTAPATLGGIVSKPEFNVTSDCPASLPAGGRCQIFGTFSSYVPNLHIHSFAITSGTSGDFIPLTFYASVKSNPIKKPVLGFAPEILSFGPIAIGSSETKTAVLSNTGPVPAVLSPFASSPNFSIQSDCPGTLAPQAQCNVAVTFTAQSSGTPPLHVLEVQAQEKVHARLINQAEVIGPKDTTELPALSFAPESLPFNSVPVGEVVVRRVALSNSGTVPATIKSIVADYGGSNFSQVNDCGSSIAPGGSCELTVSFKATAASQQLGRLRVETVEGVAGNLHLSGTGQAAVLVASPGVVPLDTIVLPGVSRPKLLSLANTGNIPLTGLSLDNTDNRLTVGYGDCTDTLQPNTGCNLTVQYAPATDGAFNTRFKVSSSNGGVATIGVTGAAVKLSVTPSQLEFPETVEGTSAPDQSITVTNTGGAAMVLDGVSISAGSLNFNKSDNCGGVLPARASCQITVRYSPNGAIANSSTTHHGQLSITMRSTEVARVALTGTGLNPRLVIAPAAVRSPAAMVGTSSSPVSFDVINPTQQAVAISGMSIVSGRAEFGQTNDCGTELGAGKSCKVTVLFTPAEKGERVGTWGATTSLGTYGAGLAGTGSVTLDFSATSLNFSPTKAGSSSEVLTVIIHNPTKLAADFSSAGYGMSMMEGGAEFGHSNTCGASLAPGARCAVNLQFTPKTEGDKSGVWLASSSFGNYFVSLTGVSTKPEGSVDPSIVPGPPTPDGFKHYAITFLDTEVNVSSPVRDIKFTNKGTGPLVIQGITQVAGEEDFRQSNNCGEVLPAGKFCTISLLFTPSALGERTGTVVLLSETGDYAFDLWGKGVGATGQWVADSSADFGDVPLGGVGTRSFTLKNTGTLTANNLYVSLTGSALTLTSNSCGTAQSPVSIPAGGSCKASVQYSPTTAGALSGALVAHGRLANAPATITLVGNAPAPALSFDSNPSGDYGAVTVGTSNTRTFVLKNSGKFADVLTPAPTITGEGFAITSGTCTAELSLPANGTCTIVVTETANKIGKLSGVITATSKQGATTQLALSANAIQSAYAITGGAGSSSAPATDYGRLTAGSPNPVVKYYYLRDNSNAAVVVSSLTALQGDSSFTMTNLDVTDAAGALVATCPFTPSGSTARCSAGAPGQAIRVGVKFAPTSAGTKNVTLRFDHNGAQGSSTIQLTGTGVFDANGVWSTDPSTIAPPTATSTDYGNITVGSGTVEKTFYVINRGQYGGAGVGFTLSGDTGPFQIVRVLRVGVGGNGGYDSAACIAGGAIAADRLSATPCLAQEPGWPATANVAITVRFTPTAAGNYSLVVTPTTNNGTVLPAPITLTGTGLFNAKGIWSSDWYSTAPPSAAFLNYGSQPRGTSSEKTIYVKNTGTNGAVSVGFTLSGDTSQFQIVNVSRVGVGGNGGYASAGCLAGGAVAADRLSTTPCLAQEPGWPATPTVAIVIRYTPTIAGSHSLTVTPSTNNGTILPEPITVTGTGQ